jgi:hypothetical protein
LLEAEVREILYDNPLDGPNCVEDFDLEGMGATSFPMGAMRLDSCLDPEQGQAAQIVFWCPEEFPDPIRITVTQGAGPLPGIAAVHEPYRMTLIKSGRTVHFGIRDLTVFSSSDPGTEFGSPLGGRRLGFRQRAPLIAEYSNLRVEAITPLSLKY